MKPATTVLEMHGVSAGYLGMPVVRDVSLRVGQGEVVALVGLNGAGKTTTLRAITGEIGLASGRISWKSADIAKPAYQRARRGLGYVAEDRSVFMTLTVRENLRLGRGSLREFLELFPEFDRLLDTRVGSLSGGEQQMLALGLALSNRPKVLLIDEFSLGLAPKVVARLSQTVTTAARSGLAVLLVEQQVQTILGIADRGYVLDRGSITHEGPVDELTKFYSGQLAGSGAPSVAAPHTEEDQGRNTK